MAIQKSKTLSNGTSGNYWRITSLVLDRSQMLLTAKIDLFVDKDHAMDGQNLGITKVYSCAITHDQSISNMISLMYASILSQAAVLRSVSISGSPLSPPQPYDSDLSGGESV